MTTPDPAHRTQLLRLARRAMVENGLQPDFSPEAIAESEKIAGPVERGGDGVRDLTGLAWCSIDNDDSRDLDQLTVANPAAAGGPITVFVAVAYVTALVPAGSALDDHAVANTTSVYTPPAVFPMLPERLSTDLTSLGEDVDRFAMVIELTVDAEGRMTASSIYPAMVRNKAKLAYPGVGSWLENGGEMPQAMAAVPGLADNIRLQDEVAQRLRARRHELGALELETIEVRPRFEGEMVAALLPERRSRSKELIEDFMIAANGAIARFLGSKRFPVMRRVVRTPERWPRIVEIADALGEKLPEKADPRALNEFLQKRRAADPVRFPDLSLSIIKLLGRGEYVASFPDEKVEGHFGLAASEYTHSTAPNRRYPDIITQRLLGAAIAGEPAPYGRDQLEALAVHCTKKEDDAQKVERLTRKSAAACLLSSRIGEEFDGVVTGASEKGTWARIFDPPVEGRIEHGASGLDVGDRVHVKLVHTDCERGFIDFAALNRPGAAPRDGHRGSSGAGSP